VGEENFRIMQPWAVRALAGEDVVFERTLDRPGKPRRHLLVRFFPDRDEHGAVRGIYTLSIDISDRKEHEERLKLLAAEVDHRAKNMLALVQIMLRQTRADSVKAFVGAAQGRVSALARAHALLSEQRWVGADLARLVQDELAPYRIQDRQRVLIDGPAVALSARAAQSCALALHELTTNAAKYGSLSTAEGRVECTWRREGGSVVLTWRERGGPAVRLPETRGFGMNVIERSIAQQLEGEVRFDWRREGLLCTLILPAQGAPA
jgi:two-component sensor histidine kinase